MTPAEFKKLLNEKSAAGPTFGRQKSGVQQRRLPEKPTANAATKMRDFESLLSANSGSAVATPPAAETAPAPIPSALASLPETPSFAALDADAMLSPHLEKGLALVLESFKKTVDAHKLFQLGRAEATIEIQLIVEQIVRHTALNLSAGETRRLAKALIDEVLGLGPLEPLLARDDISEIMVNGPDTIYIEIDGIVEKSPLAFRDEAQLVNICQRIASRVGRHVDDGNPICDARLADGSRVNIILPPLSLRGATLTIRKFKRDRLTLDKLVALGSIDELGAELIRMIAGCRVNVIVSGGTGSGKTTMLNCLTRYIHHRERVITCEDAAELQCQQPHLVQLETRQPNVEGAGEVTMRDLVRNCLRMRPERIIVGEVRGPEAFDLLQAMNTGHDGSMGTVHANSPRDALARIEGMIAMNKLNIPMETIRQQIASSVDVIVQVQRLRDGTRKVVSITEVSGMEGDVIMLQSLLSFEIDGEDAEGRVQGHFKASGLHPRFYQKLKEFGMQHKYDALVEKLVKAKS
jgi:pilus assembly protein CpaF